MSLSARWGQPPNEAGGGSPRRTGARPALLLALLLGALPAVAQDGGDILFSRFDVETGVVWLNMRGACSGCPSSTATLKHGIQNLLRHFVPEVIEVQPM